MLTSADVQSRLKEQPFHPFRLITSAGQQFDVHHPDLVLVGRRFLIVGIPGAEEPGFADQVSRISLLHLTELRDLPMQVSA